MSEKEKKQVNSPIVASGFWIGFALLFIFFWGEPDIHDLLIAFLEKLAYN